jgi:hypothetical protein
MAGLREYLPHNQGKARRGNRDSEEPSKQRPRPGSCDRKSLGRGVTRRSKTRTGFGHPGPTPARYGLVWNPLHVSSLLFKLPVTTGASSSSSKAAAFIRGDRSSSVASRFARPPALCGSGGASLTGFSRATRPQPGHPRLGLPIRWDAGSHRDRRDRRARNVTRRRRVARSAGTAPP